MVFIRSPATEKDDGWLVLDRDAAAAASAPNSPTVSAFHLSLKPKNTTNKKIMAKKQQQKRQGRLRIVYNWLIFFLINLLRLGVAIISWIDIACLKVFLCLRTIFRKFNSDAQFICAKAKSRFLSICRSLLARSGAAAAQALAWIAYLGTACKSRLSWFGTPSSQAFNKFSMTCIAMCAVMAYACFIGHTLSTVVLNVPRPRACFGPYKQLSVDISSHYIGPFHKVADLDTSHRGDPVLTITQSVQYLQEATAAAASLNTTTATPLSDKPIQVPLEIQPLPSGSTHVNFHVSVKCQAGPLTLSRRDHYYLRSDGLYWQSHVLDPVDRDNNVRSRLAVFGH
ncbi:hypothetical protein PG989_001900 [Apiospora arundinis]|uniref:Uncharacterized protein n=1 Tax=Apiospora arundinis TaxID=335852 RepID=A0ABR2HN20_9PEZI